MMVISLKRMVRKSRKVGGGRQVERCYLRQQSILQASHHHIPKSRVQVNTMFLSTIRLNGFENEGWLPATPTEIEHT